MDRTRSGGVGTPFVRSGDGQAVATLDVPITGTPSAHRVTEVAALDTKGKVLAIVRGAAQVDASIRVYLDFPSTATGDQSLVIRAMIEGLPLDLASRAHCRWSVSPDVGTFASLRTPISVSNLGRAASIAVLKLDPHKTQVGMKPKIAVDLVLGD
jgi:hypothetical protein